MRKSVQVRRRIFEGPQLQLIRSAYQISKRNHAFQANQAIALHMHATTPENVFAEKPCFERGCKAPALKTSGFSQRLLPFVVGNGDTVRQECCVKFGTKYYLPREVSKKEKSLAN